MRTRKVGDEVYSRLKGMILSNHLKTGQKLLDRELAKELMVSRTPVREALGRLEQEGLAQNKAGRGYFVAEMDGKQIEDLYGLREVLETEAVRLATENAMPADLEEIETLLAAVEDQPDSPANRAKEIKISLQIHEIIGRASGNGFLSEALIRLLDRMSFFIWIGALNEDSRIFELHRQEHKQLLRLIREKGKEEAESLMRRHIRRGKEHILDALKARDAFYNWPIPVDMMARNRERKAKSVRKTGLKK